MLTVALFSHTPHLCGAERMLVNLAILLERSKTIHPVLLVAGRRRPGSRGAAPRAAHARSSRAPPWYLLPPGNMNDYGRGVTDCSEALSRSLSISTATPCWSTR